MGAADWALPAGAGPGRPAGVAAAARQVLSASGQLVGAGGAAGQVLSAGGQQAGAGGAVLGLTAQLAQSAGEMAADQMEHGNAGPGSAHTDRPAGRR